MAGIDLVATFPEMLIFLAIPHKAVKPFKYANTSWGISLPERHNLPRVPCPKNPRQSLIELKHGAGDQSHAASHALCRI
jgi:hypothetical protein